MKFHYTLVSGEKTRFSSLTRPTEVHIATRFSATLFSVPNMDTHKTNLENNYQLQNSLNKIIPLSSSPRGWRRTGPGVGGFNGYIIEIIIFIWGFNSFHFDSIPPRAIVWVEGEINFLFRSLFSQSINMTSVIDFHSIAWWDYSRLGITGRGATSLTRLWQAHGKREWVGEASFPIAGDK